MRNKERMENYTKNSGRVYRINLYGKTRGIDVIKNAMEMNLFSRALKLTGTNNIVKWLSKKLVDEFYSLLDKKISREVFNYDQIYKETKGQIKDAIDDGLGDVAEKVAEKLLKFGIDEDTLKKHADELIKSLLSNESINSLVSGLSKLENYKSYAKISDIVISCLYVPKSVKLFYDKYIKNTVDLAIKCSSYAAAIAKANSSSGLAAASNASLVITSANFGAKVVVSLFDAVSDLQIRAKKFFDELKDLLNNYNKSKLDNISDLREIIYKYGRIVTYDKYGNLKNPKKIQVPQRTDEEIFEIIGFIIISSNQTIVNFKEQLLSNDDAEILMRHLKAAEKNYTDSKKLASEQSSEQRGGIIGTLFDFKKNVIDVLSKYEKKYGNPNTVPELKASILLLFAIIKSDSDCLDLLKTKPMKESYNDIMRYVSGAVVNQVSKGNIDPCYKLYYSSVEKNNVNDPIIRRLNKCPLEIMLKSLKSIIYGYKKLDLNLRVKIEVLLDKIINKLYNKRISSELANKL